MPTYRECKKFLDIQHKIHFVSLSTSDFFWIGSTDWDIEHQLFFADNRYKKSANIFSSPPFSKKPKLIASRWILADSKRQFKGWAEVQVNNNSFRSLLLFFGGDAFEHEIAPFLSPAISLLISSLFILAEADLITLFLNANLKQFSFAEDWGVKKNLWSPQWKDIFSGKLKKYECMDIFSNEWWNHEIGKKDRETLNFLEVRKKRFQQVQKKSIFHNFWKRFS